MVGIACKVETYVFNQELQDTPESTKKRDEAYRVLLLENDSPTKQAFANQLLGALRKKPGATKFTSDVAYAALLVTGFNPRTLADLVQHNRDIQNLILGDAELTPSQKTTEVALPFPAVDQNQTTIEDALSKNAEIAQRKVTNLLLNDADFGYNFFADLKFSHANTIRPAVLRSYALANSGAALGILINPALKPILEKDLFGSEIINNAKDDIKALRDTVFLYEQQIDSVKKEAADPKSKRYKDPTLARTVIEDLRNKQQKDEQKIELLKESIQSELGKVESLLSHAASQPEEHHRHYFPMTLDLMLTDATLENKKVIVSILKKSLGNNTEDNVPIRDFCEKEIRPDLGRVLEKHFDVFVELVSGYYNNNLSKLLFHSPDPVKLLARLIKHAKTDSGLQRIMTEQMGTILATFIAKKSAGEYKNSSLEEMTKLAKPYVNTLIASYATEKTSHRADELMLLFKQPTLIEKLQLSKQSLQNISEDKNFLHVFNREVLENSSREIHWVKSWLNKRFGLFPDQFNRQQYNLDLSQQKQWFNVGKLHKNVFTAKLNTLLTPVTITKNVESSKTTIDPFVDNIVAPELTVEQEIDLTTGPAQHSVVSDTDEDALPYKAKAKPFNRTLTQEIESVET
ncbi:MAG: hypothetical protein SFW07_04420, partial [Gammaproteobacteria bacterium]|nr:hypothetical protein [Gammaproteobacteria bacterium]